ncbi:MAG: Ig-like domain-containing protein, partial [Luminiphilus sp.]
PNAGFVGSDSLLVEVSDGQGGSAQATISFTVNNINDAPVAQDDVTLETNENTAITSDGLLLNDSDADGDLLTIIDAQAGNGTVVINSDGTVTYTPNTDFVGTDTVTYTVSDGNGGSDTAQFTVTVVGVNTPPTISDQNFTVDENGSVTGQVVASDADGDSLSFNVLQGVSSGQLTFGAGGNFTYTPNAGFVGSDSLLVEVSDGQGGTAQATISFTVNNVNDAPVANNDPDENTLEDETLTITGVLSNDTDVDSDTLSLVSATAISGSVAVSGANLVYTPNQDFNGTDTVTYTVSDGNGGTDTAQVKVVVAPVNDPPTVVNDSGYVTPFETAVTLENVLANDSDIDGDVISIASASSANGQAVFNADQTITFTPNSGFSGQATVTYVISDPSGLTATGTASVTVLQSNSPPTAVDDTGLVMEAGTTIVLDRILSNDSDLDGDEITLVSATTTEGTVTVSSPTSLSLTVPKDTPATSVQVTYTIQDTLGQTATATVTIEVIPDNFAPIANDDVAVTIFEGEVATTGDVLANDTDADGDALTIVSATAPNGSVTVNADGTLSYTPNSGFIGDDVITYTVDDGRGARDSAVVIVTVVSVDEGPSNEIPSANDDPSLTTPFETPIANINVLANDTDPDGSALTVIQASAQYGSVTINSDSSLNYTPGAGFSGNDVVTYTVSDGEGGRDSAIFTVMVGAGLTNTAPRALPDGPFTIALEETQITFNVLTNDVDPDGDPIELLNASADDGRISAKPDGTIVYTKPSAFDGSDTIRYTITDGKGGIGNGKATVTGPATITNRAPVAVADGPFTVVEGGRAKDIDVLANDTDADGDLLILTSATADSGTATVSDDNTIDYVAAPGFTGTATITYQVSDGSGGTASATATINIVAAKATNTAPVAASAQYKVTTDQALASLLPAATDAELDPIRYVLAIAPKDGFANVDGNGRFTYKPEPGFVGTDTFFFYVTDGQLNSRNYQVTLDIDGDSDGDGYLDSIDQCVNTDPGSKVDGTGCATQEADDFDGDGVPNTADNCPSTPAGQDVDENGCSEEQIEEEVEDFRDIEDDVEEVAQVEVVQQETKSLAATVNTDCNSSIGQGVSSGQQSSLGSACQSLKSGENSSEQVKEAVEEINYEEVGTLSDTAIATTSNQTQAVGQRMQVVNTGGGGGSVSVDGLNIRYGKQSIPTIALQEAVNALLGFAAGEGDSEESFIDFGKLGIFIQGDLDFGDRDATDTQMGYESDSWNLTIGGDYRFKDNLYGGLAFNFGQTDVTYDTRGDESTIENWGMSVYGGWQITEAWYVDGLISYGSSDYSTLRNIEYTLNTGDFSATQRGDTAGTQLSYGINTGYMYNKNGFRFGPILSLFYSDGTIDGFKERAIKGSDAWAFEVGEQTIQSTRMSAGLQMDYSWSTDWGVLIPGIRAAYVREKEGSDDTVVVRLANGDNFADGTSRFAITNQKDDEGYYDISVNVSGQFVMGISGFVSYQFYQDYRGYTREGYSVGIRWDKPF